MKIIDNKQFFLLLALLVSICRGADQTLRGGDNNGEQVDYNDDNNKTIDELMAEEEASSAKARGRKHSLSFRGKMKFSRGGFDDQGCDRRTRTQVCLVGEDADADTRVIPNGKTNVNKLGWRVSYENVWTIDHCSNYGKPGGCLEALQMKNKATTWTIPVELNVDTRDDYADLAIYWEYGCRGFNFWWGSCGSMANQDTDHITDVTFKECTIDGRKGKPKITKKIRSGGLLLKSSNPVRWSTGTNNNVKDPTEGFYARMACA